MDGLSKWFSTAFFSNFGCEHQNSCQSKNGITAQPTILPRPFELTQAILGKNL